MKNGTVYPVQQSEIFILYTVWFVSCSEDELVDVTVSEVLPFEVTDSRYWQPLLLHVGRDT